MILTTILFIAAVSTVIVLVTQPPLGDAAVLVLAFELIRGTCGHPTLMLVLSCLAVILTVTLPAQRDALALTALELLCCAVVGFCN